MVLRVVELESRYDGYETRIKSFQVKKHYQN